MRTAAKKKPEISVEIEATVRACAKRRVGVGERHQMSIELSVGDFRPGEPLTFVPYVTLWHEREGSAPTTETEAFPLEFAEDYALLVAAAVARLKTSGLYSAAPKLTSLPGSGGQSIA